MIMKALLAVAAIVLLSSTASAWPDRDHEDECEDASRVLGRCGTFGAGYIPILFRLELGLVSDQRTISAGARPDDDQRITGTLANDARLESRAFALRTLGGWRGLYVGMEFLLGRIDNPPTVGRPPSGVVPSRDDETEEEGELPFLSDMIMNTRLVAGGELRRGRLLLGAELAVGASNVMLGGGTAHDGQLEPYVDEFFFTFDARGRAGVWLTPHLTVSVIASQSVINDRERMFGLMIGVSPFAWDGLP